MLSQPILFCECINDYEKVDDEVVCGSILGKVSEVEEFLRQVEAGLMA